MRQNSGANYGRLHIKIRIVSLVLCIIMMLGMFPVNVFAADVIYSGYCGGEGDGTNLTWELDSDGLLTISGTGRMKDYNSYSDTPWSVRRSQINQVRVGDDVTSLDAEACWYLTEIEKVILGDGITELEASSFRKCKKLKTVVLGNNVSEIGGSAFDGCQSLTSFVVPDGATEIKSYTFNDCTNLEKVTIGNNVKTIGESSFQDCENLKRISFPDSVTKIESWAFNDCENLTEVIIGKGIEEIDVYAFYDCVSLTDVYYVGSEEEWNNISIGPVNGCFTGANVHFNYVRENEPPADAAEFNGHYYKVYSIDTSATGAEAWAEAKAHCEELGGYLAVISSQEENDFLLDYLLSVGETNAYFGFTDEAETGVWKWIDAPETSEYVNWATNEPNSRSEHYAMFYYGGSYFVNGEWNNGSFGNGTLDDDKNYICEWIGDDASTCPTVTNLQSSYTITEGDDLSLSFTVKAGGKDGLLDVVTVREPEADKQYYRQTDINAASLTVNITISDLSTGSHTLYVYATANNFTGDPVTGNNVIATIEVTVEPLVVGVPENAQLYNGNKYYLYDKSMTWDEAKAYCEDLGGHLVTITDANEQAFLTSMVDGAAQNCYWIGATSTTGSWEWVTNEAFSYTNWKNAEPNNESGIENYAVMIAKEEGASQHGFSVKVGSWNDVSVTGHNGKKDNPFYSPDSLGFICEWEAASVKPTVTGLQSGYTLTEGQELSLNFSVKAGGTGLLNVVTIREPDADKQYYRQADINKAEHTVSTTISGLPVGLHKLVVYATATNFNGNPTNEIFEFTVTIKKNEISANNISAECLKVIKNLEGSWTKNDQHVIYDDDHDYQGWKNPTIGYGTLLSDDLVYELSNGKYNSVSDLPVNGGKYTGKKSDEIDWLYKNVGIVISEEKAEAFLLERVNIRVKNLNKYLDNYNVTLTQNQFDAVIIFLYNVNPGYLSIYPDYRISKLVRSEPGLNGENPTQHDDTVYEAFTTCSNSNIGPSVERGLIKRRLMEAKIFLNGYTSGYSPDNYATADEIDHWIYIKRNRDDASINPSVYVNENYSTPILPSDISVELCKPDGSLVKKDNLIGGYKLRINGVPRKSLQCIQCVFWSQDGSFAKEVYAYPSSNNQNTYEAIFYTYELKDNTKYNIEVFVWFSDGTYLSAAELSLTTGCSSTIPNIKGAVIQQNDKSFDNTDFGWNKTPYLRGDFGNGLEATTIGRSGCNIVCLANAIWYMNKMFINPNILADYAIQNGYRTDGSFNTEFYEAFAKTDAGEKYNFTVGNIEYMRKGNGYTGNVITASWTSLTDHLKKGGVVIGNVPGHIIAVVDYDEDTQKYLVYDSYASPNNRKTSINGDWKSKSELCTGKMNLCWYIPISKKK